MTSEFSEIHLLNRIEQIGKKKFKLYIDDVFYCILYEKEIAAYHLHEGNSISAEQLTLLCKECLLPRAKRKAMSLLMLSDKTVTELREGLQQAGFPEVTIAEVIQYLDGYHYLDDKRVAKQYLRYGYRSKGAYRLRMELKEKGIAEDLIHEAMQEIAADAIDGELPKTEDCIRELIEKRYGKDFELTPALRQKIIGYLFRRGFSMEEIRKAYRFDEDC